MTTARRPAWRAAVTAVVLLAIGLGVALGVGSALGISAEPVDGMDAASHPVGTVAPAVPPPTIEVLDHPGTERTTVALDELTDAVASAPTRQGRATLTLRDGDGDTDDDTYRLGGNASALEVTAASESGAVRAVYDLAAAVRSGHAVTEHLGDEVRSRLPFRMVDLGAVGVTPDPAEWESGTDYSHASKAFADVILPTAPYVDQAALAKAYTDYDTFLRHSLANGYTAVAFPGFIEYVTLQGAPTVRCTPRATSTSHGRWRCARPSARSGTGPSSSG